VQHLSLRYNGITDVGASRIGSALGNFSQQNQNLLSLNLAGNKISDAGASHIANVSSVLAHLSLLFQRLNIAFRKKIYLLPNRHIACARKQTAHTADIASLKRNKKKMATHVIQNKLQN